MKMFLLKTVLFLFLINISISAQSVGLNFSLAFPQGDFKQNVDKVGFGLSLEGVYFFNPLVGIGLNGGFITMAVNREVLLGALLFLM